MHCAQLNIHQANEIIGAMGDAIKAVNETGKAHTVVYSDKLRAAISMPSDPLLHQYGWTEVITVGLTYIA